MNLRDFINEARVSADKELTASKKIVDYIGKKLGIELFFVDFEEYKNADGKFSGYLYVSNEGPAFRVNWDKGEFRSLNFWDKYCLDAIPTTEVFAKDLDTQDSSFIRIIPKMLSKITGGDMDESMIVEKTIEYKGNSWPSPKDFMKAAVTAGWDVSQIQAILKQNGNTYSASQIETMLIKNGLMKPAEMPEDTMGDVMAKPGKPEEVMAPPSAEQMKKEVDKVKYADPETVFEDLDSYVTLVAQGLMPALLITGQGGIGKSYGVEKVLKSYGTKGEDYVIMKGKCTPINMYRFLYTHYNKIVVFDDCDSIFDSKDGINILKGALDSGVDREISWDTQNTIDTYGMSHEEIEKVLADYSAAHDGKRGIPSFFGFEGAVIFISNMFQEDIQKKDRAILTRCQNIDIVLKAQDVINRIKSVLPDLKVFRAISKRGEAKDITDEGMKQEVFEFMTSEDYRQHSDPSKEINFRTFIKAYYLRYSGVPNWKRLAYNT